MATGVGFDLRTAFRQLWRHRTFSALIVTTVALGVAATSTFFSILNGLAFRPLPFADPHQLMAIHRTNESGARRSGPRLGDVDAVRDLDAIDAAVAHVTLPVNLAVNAPAREAIGTEVSDDLFGLLGVTLHRGRPLTSSDVGSRVAVIGYDLWAASLSGDEAAMGATIQIDGLPYTIVGIASRGYSFPADSRVWLPLRRAEADRPVGLTARLNVGASPRGADVALRSREVLANRTDTGRWSLAAEPLRDAVLGTKQRDAASALLVAAGLVLAIACANLAGLLVAYVTGRRHELAVRAAVGASRGRIVRTLMTESVVLALCGGLIGYLLAHWGVDLFVATLGKPVGAEWLTFSVDLTALAFAIGAALVAAVLFGLFPALVGSRTDLRRVLQEDRQAGSGSSIARRTRSVLVGGQIALSLALVAGAGSIVSSGTTLRDAHPGFDRERLLVAQIPLRGSRYEAVTARSAFVDATKTRIAGLAGVTGVAAVTHPPLVERNVPATSFALEGWAATEQLPHASFRFVDADYFGVMGVPIRAGRTFTAAEIRQPQSVVVNETMARRHWPGLMPVGRRLRLPGSADPAAWLTVIGVVGDVAQRNLPIAPENQLYFPLPASGGREMSLVVRTSGDVAAAAREVQAVISTLDPDVAVTTRSMIETYGAYVRDRSLQGVVLGSLGLVAVAVAALGIYGLMSLVVAERSRELAIRAALGGSARAIRLLVLQDGARLSAGGVVAGLVLALGVTALLSFVFFGLRPFDVRIVAAAAAILVAVALGASWFPARQATRVDPAVALRFH